MRSLLAATGVLLVVACGSLESSPSEPSPGDAGADACATCAADDAGDEAPAAPPQIIDVAAGGGFGCALRDDGTVACWGNGNGGALGRPPDGEIACDGASRCRPTPSDVPGLSGVKKLAAGLTTACAIDAGGALLCWGDNAHGNLGLGVATPANRFTPGAVPLSGPALDVAVGSDVACARVAEDGGVEVYCWGSAAAGVVGAPLDASVRGPTRIPGLSGALQISVANTLGMACAVRADASVVCWGANIRGSLGHVANTAGDVTCANFGFCNPTPSVVGDATFKALAVQAGHVAACARTLEGGVACWGYGDLGALGRGSFDSVDHPAPQAIPSLAGASDLSMHALHGCAVVGGEASCWGTDMWGEIGDGLASSACTSGYRCQPTPTKLTVIAAKRVSAGASFTLVLDEAGDVWSWGANLDGRCGHAPGTSNDIATCGANTTHCSPNPQPIAF